MEISEFLNRQDETPDTDDVQTEQPEEIDVQKAVVESLAADKAEQDEIIASLKARNASLQAEVDALSSQLVKARAETAQANAALKKVNDELSGLGEVLVRNKERDAANQVALLERSVEIDDKFEGETRDHVLEAIRDARDAAEKDGRFRRAQVLESVLVANEPNGELVHRREELEKMFTENANVISGVVIERLQKMGLSHKNGEEYLLPSEIIARNY